MEMDTLRSAAHLAREIGDELFAALVSSDNTTKVKEFAQSLVKPVEPALPTGQIFKVAVDYGQTLEQMIAAGRYDWVSSGITPKRFPISGEGGAERELVLVHPNKVASTDEVLAELDRHGLRPAKIEEILALGAAHPELQREFPIVELGSSFVDGLGSRRFAYLGRYVALRGLRLFCDVDGWGVRCRFLAARK